MKILLLSLLFVFHTIPNNKSNSYNSKSLEIETTLNNKIYNTSILFIKSQESISIKPYKSGNNWLIGWGHLMNKKELKLYKKGITLKQADSLFNNDYNKIIETTKHNFPTLKSYKKLIVVSMISYNIGTDFSNHSLGKAIRTGKDIKPYLFQYKFSGGRVVYGLIKRRKEELKLWNVSQDKFISYADLYNKNVEKNIKKIL